MQRWGSVRPVDSAPTGVFHLRLRGTVRARRARSRTPSAACARSPPPTSRARSGVLTAAASLSRTTREGRTPKSGASSARAVHGEPLPGLRRLAERSARPSVGKDAGFVGAGRFELPTSRTRTVRATKLRYAPKEGADNETLAAVCQARRAFRTPGRILGWKNPASTGAHPVVVKL